MTCWSRLSKLDIPDLDSTYFLTLEWYSESSCFNLLCVSCNYLLKFLVVDVLSTGLCFYFSRILLCLILDGLKSIRFFNLVLSLIWLLILVSLANLFEALGSLSFPYSSYILPLLSIRFVWISVSVLVTYIRFCLFLSNSILAFLILFSWIVGKFALYIGLYSLSS